MSAGPSSHGDILSEQNNSSNTPHHSLIRRSRQVLPAEHIHRFVCKLRENFSGREDSEKSAATRTQGRERHPPPACQARRSGQGDTATQALGETHFEGELKSLTPARVHSGSAKKKTLDKTDVAQTCSVPFAGQRQGNTTSAASSLPPLCRVTTRHNSSRLTKQRQAGREM